MYYRNSRQVEIEAHRKKIDFVWLPCILSDEVGRIERTDRSIKPNALEMSSHHGVLDNVSDLPQDIDQSSSSMNNRVSPDVTLRHGLVRTIP